MNLFSVIIPTLFCSERIHKLIKDLGECGEVGEIIVIDNNRKFYNHYPTIFKGRIIGPEENLYVGPSWNLGVKIAQYDNIALCNDDINFNPSIFKDILPFLKDSFIGMDRYNYGYDKFDHDISVLPLEDIRPFGWGCLLLFKKEVWLDIPEQLKIWCTDDWIIKFNPVKKYVLYNFPIQTDMSTTSDKVEFSEVKSKDMIYWDSL